MIKSVRENNNCEIPNTGRVERIMKLLPYLNDWRSIQEMANHIQVSKKSIQRYLTLFVRLGFTIEGRHWKSSVYRIKNLSEYFTPKKK